MYMYIFLFSLFLSHSVASCFTINLILYDSELCVFLYLRYILFLYLVSLYNFLDVRYRIFVFCNYHIIVITVTAWKQWGWVPFILGSCHLLLFLIRGVHFVFSLFLSGHWVGSLEPKLIVLYMLGCYNHNTVFFFFLAAGCLSEFR